MTDKAEEPTELRRYTYAGRLISRGKVLHASITPDGEELWHAKKPAWFPKYAGDGQVYDVTFVVGSSQFYVTGPRGPKYIGLHEDAAKRAEWDLRDRAADAFLSQERAVKKAGGVDPVAELAEPLRRLYAAASPFERSALLVRVLAAIQSGR